MGWVIILILLINSAFSSNGFNGVFELFRQLFVIIFGILKIMNVFSLFATGDSIFTKIFSGYFIYVCVGFLFELVNIKNGCFGKIFGKVSYWIVGFPVSALLNWISTLIF